MNNMNLQNFQHDILGSIPAIVFVLSLFAFIIYKIISFKVKSKKDMVLKVVLLSIIVIICLVAAISDGKIYVLMVIDYCTSNYANITGNIIDVNRQNSFSGTFVDIDNIKYYCDSDVADNLDNYIGEKCDLIYGTNSKYVVQYSIIYAK